MKSVLLVGVGGQGILLASKILISGLVSGGYNVKMSEIHGMSQRGGTVSTHVRFGREPIFSPVIPLQTADMIIGFEAMEAARFLDYLRPGGRILLSDQEIPTIPMLTGAAVYPKDIGRTLSAAADTVELPVLSLAAALGSEKSANMILLGAGVKLLGLDSIDWDEVIRASVKPEFVPLSIRALELGESEVQHG